MSTTDGGTWYHGPATTIEETITRQSPTIDGWICPTCKHHGGGLKCDKHVFISVVGANMSRCKYYEDGVRCKHCGKVT